VLPALTLLGAGSATLHSHPGGSVAEQPGLLGHVPISVIADPDARSAAFHLHSGSTVPSDPCVACVLSSAHGDVVATAAPTATAPCIPIAVVAIAQDGSFKFFNMPFNLYELHIELQGFKAMRQHVEVRSIVAVKVTVRLELAPATASVTVEAEPTAVQLETDTSMSHLDIDKSYIARAPATIWGRAMDRIKSRTILDFSMGINLAHYFSLASLKAARSEWVGAPEFLAVAA
jgi:hypothetical protein